MRSVATAWLNGGLFMMSRDMGSEGGISVEVFLAVGSTEHTVSCVGNCPTNLTVMAEGLWAELSEDVMSELPEFEF